MKKLGVMKRLGARIILISVISLFLTVVLILSAAVMMFRNYSDEILVERANVGMQVLEDTINGKLAQLPERYALWSSDAHLVTATKMLDGSYFEESWNKNAENDGSFLAISDAAGQTVFRSQDCPFVNFSMAEVAAGKTVSGIIAEGDTLVAIFAAPFSMKGIDGAIAVGFDMSNSGWMEQTKELASCDVTIFKDNIRLSSTIINPENNQPVVGTPMGENIKKVVIDSKKSYTGKATIVGRQYYVSYDPMFDNSGSVIGAFFAGSDATEANAEFAKVIAVAIAIGLIALAVTASVIFVFTRRNVVKPIEQVTLLAEEMEEGRLHDTDVDFAFGEDEVGSFARKLQQTKERLSNYINDISTVLAAMGEGDFTKQPGVKYHGDFTKIERSFGEIEVRLADIVGNMDVSADGVKNGAGQIANGSQLLAEGTTRQATAIEELNATVAGINRQIADTAQNADQANVISAGCLNKVQEQNEQMNSMLAAMDEIRDKSAKISAIIKTIEDIAFQTNILALNASVEAARAGEAGKGFAVVADEVRNLAAKSGEAASNTNVLISDTVKAVNEGVELAQRTAEIMDEVIEQTKKTNDIITEIDKATKTQADAVQQVSVGISDISSVIAQNSATAEETAASCQELASQSNLLKTQVDMFKV